MHVLLVTLCWSPYACSAAGQLVGICGPVVYYLAHQVRTSSYAGRQAGSSPESVPTCVQRAPKAQQRRQQLLARPHMQLQKLLQAFGLCVCVCVEGEGGREGEGRRVSWMRV